MHGGCRAGGVSQVPVRAKSVTLAPVSVTSWGGVRLGLSQSRAGGRLEKMHGGF